MNPEARLEQLRQLLADAVECDDADKVKELEADISQEFPGQTTSEP
jgi:hypothetical protein